MENIDTGLRAIANRFVPAASVETLVTEVKSLYGAALGFNGVSHAANGVSKPAAAPAATAKKTAKKVAAKKKAAPKGEKRDPAVLEKIMNQILVWVKAHPGDTVEKIKVGTGLTTKEMTLPIRKLVKSKALGTTGQKRATQYFPAS